MEKGMLNNNLQKFYNVFYFMFWGFYFSAGYFFCRKLNIPNNECFNPHSI